MRTIPLPAGARFLGYSEGIAAYGIGRELRLRRLTNGQRPALPSGSSRASTRSSAAAGSPMRSGRTLGFSAWAIVSSRV